jgi:hypothetical protein
MNTTITTADFSHWVEQTISKYLSSRDFDHITENDIHEMITDHGDFEYFRFYDIKEKNEGKNYDFIEFTFSIEYFNQVVSETIQKVYMRIEEKVKTPSVFREVTMVLPIQVELKHVYNIKKAVQQKLDAHLLRYALYC